MVPLLALGIPGSGATAVILGAFLLHGVQPGPQIFQTEAAMVYTIFASMFAAVLGMCLLGYFAIKPLIRVLQLPEAVTSAFVALFCFIGAYSARNSLTDLWMIVIFGVVGYLFERFRFPIAPMVLGCILGPIAENVVHDQHDRVPERLDGVLHAADLRHDHGADGAGACLSDDPAAAPVEPDVAFAIARHTFSAVNGICSVARLSREAVARQRVDHRVDDRRRRADRAELADALHAHRDWCRHGVDSSIVISKWRIIRARGNA